MNIARQHLTLEMVEKSPDIESWLNQFPEERRSTALDLLLKLQFIRQDVYGDWLKDQITAIPDLCALYAVRKFPESTNSYWDSNGQPPPRPATSMGSEDLVQSVLANLLKGAENRFYDHPGIPVLRESRIHNIVLIDDSLGSGKRLIEFIKLFLIQNKTIRSWWSFGWIRLYVIALVRSRAAEDCVLNALPGSDHHRRMYRKSTKLKFIGYFQHDDLYLDSLWGANAVQIQDLCDSVAEVPQICQRGFGGVMSNTVFYHSVPDNLPGILWYSDGDWTPLFPMRTFPVWLSRLLSDETSDDQTGSYADSATKLLPLLRAVRRGIRREWSIARALGVDQIVIAKLVDRARSAGLLSDKNRLTSAGFQLVRDSEKALMSPVYDRSLYVPKSWSVDQGTVQPPASNGVTRQLQAEFTAGLPAVDGDAGWAFLERTDARAAAPPMSVVPHLPSKARVGDDTHGPRAERVE